MLEQIKRLAKTGLSIMLSTHDPDHALACADRVAVLAGGKITAYGTRAKVVTAKRLREVHGVGVRIERLSGSQIVCAPSFSR